MFYSSPSLLGRVEASAHGSQSSYGLFPTLGPEILVGGIRDRSWRPGLIRFRALPTPQLIGCLNGGATSTRSLNDFPGNRQHYATNTSYLTFLQYRELVLCCDTVAVGLSDENDVHSFNLCTNKVLFQKKGSSPRHTTTICGPLCPDVILFDAAIQSPPATPPVMRSEWGEDWGEYPYSEELKRKEEHEKKLSRCEEQFPSPCSLLVALGDSKGSIRIWDFGGGKMRGNEFGGLAYRISKMVSLGRSLMTVEKETRGGTTMQEYDWVEGLHVQTFRRERSSVAESDLACSRECLFCCGSSRVLGWSRRSGNRCMKCDVPNEARSLLYIDPEGGANSGSLLLCGTSEGDVLVYDLRNCAHAASRFSIHANDSGLGVASLARVTPHVCVSLAMFGKVSAIATWNLRSGKRRGSAIVPGNARSLAVRGAAWESEESERDASERLQFGFGVSARCNVVLLEPVLQISLILLILGEH